MATNPNQKGENSGETFSSFRIGGKRSHLKGNDCEEGCKEKQIGLRSARIDDDNVEKESRILPPSILDPSPTDSDRPVGRICHSVESPASKKKIDILAKAAEVGITFPPPRWWRPGGYGPDSLENERRKK